MISLPSEQKFLLLRMVYKTACFDLSIKIHGLLFVPLYLCIIVHVLHRTQNDSRRQTLSTLRRNFAPFHRTLRSLCMTTDIPVCVRQGAQVLSVLIV